MIKFTADGLKGRVLFLGLSDGNIDLLRRGRPIKVIGKEVGCDHDVYIFWGATEQAMIDELIGAGIKLPEPKPHFDDERQEQGEQ